MELKIVVRSLEIVKNYRIVKRSFPKIILKREIEISKSPIKLYQKNFIKIRISSKLRKKKIKR